MTLIPDVQTLLGSVIAASVLIFVMLIIAENMGETLWLMFWQRRR